MVLEKNKSKEDIIFEHNKIMIEIGNICDYMIENRKYLNDVGIKNYAEKIKEIVSAYYWVSMPTWKGENEV